MCYFMMVLSSHGGLLPGDVSWQSISARPWVPSGEQKGNYYLCKEYVVSVTN